MSEKITFSYFYGQEADMLSFYRIPKLLFTNDYFRELLLFRKLNGTPFCTLFGTVFAMSA